MALRIVDDPKMVDITEVRDICREKRYQKQLAELIAGHFEVFKKANIGQFLEFLHKIDLEIVFAFYLLILRRIYDETGVDYAMSSAIDQWSLAALQNIRYTIIL